MVRIERANGLLVAFFLLAVGIIAGEFWIVHSPVYDSSRAVLSAAIAFDLAVLRTASPFR